MASKVLSLLLCLVLLTPRGVCLCHASVSARATPAPPTSAPAPRCKCCPPAPCAEETTPEPEHAPACPAHPKQAEASALPAERERAFAEAGYFVALPALVGLPLFRSLAADVLTVPPFLHPPRPVRAPLRC